MKVAIYNLSTDCWREVDDAGPYIAHFPYFETLFNGAFHWYAYNDFGGDKCEIILSFNMSSEVFRVIPFPDVCFYLDGNRKGLAVLNDSLALTLYVPSLVDAYFDIWVMNEYGVKESWTKQFTIGPLSGIYSPISFWKSEELLFEGSNGQLVSCDLNTQKLKEYQVQEGDATTTQVAIYTESLVSIKRGSRV